MSERSEEPFDKLRALAKRRMCLTSVFGFLGGSSDKCL